MEINEIESRIAREMRVRREKGMTAIQLRKEPEGILTITTPEGIKLYINHIPSVNWLTDVMIVLSKRGVGK
jgi:hypothetical protein